MARACTIGLKNKRKLHDSFPPTSGFLRQTKRSVTHLPMAFSKSSTYFKPQKIGQITYRAIQKNFKENTASQIRITEQISTPRSKHNVLAFSQAYQARNIKLQMAPEPMEPSIGSVSSIIQTLLNQPSTRLLARFTSAPLISLCRRLIEKQLAINPVKCLFNPFPNQIDKQRGGIRDAEQKQ